MEVTLPWWAVLLILLGWAAFLFFFIVKPIIDWLFLKVIGFWLRRMGHTPAEVEAMLDDLR